MSLVYISALVACFLATSSALDPHQLELKQHYEHLAYIADFPCLKPQPKVIPIHKLFSESQSHGKAYFPDVTVLYRCDECTGSCTAEHKCAPKLTELVLLPFKATYLEATEKHKVGSWAMEYHELLNHTECGCIPRPPKDSCPPDTDHMHKRDEGKKPLTSSSGRPDVSYNRPSQSNNEESDSDYRPSGSSRPSGSGSSGNGYESSSRPSGSGSSGSGYEGSSGSSNGNSGDFNNIQSVSTSERGAFHTNQLPFFRKWMTSPMVPDQPRVEGYTNTLSSLNCFSYDGVTCFLPPLSYIPVYYR